MPSRKGKRPIFAVNFYVRFFFVLLLSLAVIRGSTLPAAAEDWRNLVQPTGTLYSGLLWQMNAEGPQGPFLTPAEANSLLGTYRGCAYPPFDAFIPVSEQTSVTLIKTSKTLYFTRTFNTSDPDPGKRSYPAGSWVMRGATVRGLTPEQIRDVFALPAVPKGIAYARVPAGHVLWTGMAGPINPSVNPAYPDWGRGGGEQIFIDKRFAGSDSAEVIYISKDLSGRALLYAPIAGGGNAGNLATYLDSLIPAPATPQGTIDLAQYNSRNLSGAYSRLDDILGPLDWLSFGDRATFTSALNQIGPERYDALARVGVRNNLQFGKAFVQRGLSSRNGAEGFRTALGDDLENLRFSTVQSVRSDRGTTGAGLPVDADGPKTGKHNTNVWATGLGEFGFQDGFGEHTGFDFTTGGFVMGIDLIRKEGLLFGIGAGYLRSDLHWYNDGGRAEIDSPKLGVYSNYTDSAGWFVDGLLAGGYDRMSVKRNIVFLDVANTAQSDPDGYDFMGQVRAGRNFPIAGWNVSPVAELAYIYLHHAAFDETGADPINLSVRAKDYQTFRTQVGVRAEKDFSLAEGTQVTPSIEVAWAHEIPLDNRDIESGIIGQGGSFLVSGIDRATDSLMVDTALKARLCGNLTVYTGYGLELNDQFVSHQVNLGLNFMF